VFNFGDTTGLFFPSSTNIAFTTASAEKMRITSAGNVGIGTTTPYSKFTTYGALSTSTSQISIVNSEGGHIILRTGIQSVANSGLSIISANVDGTSQNTRLVMTGAGNVGIGTTAPAARLHVAAPGALSTDIALRVRNSADSADLMLVNGLGNVGIGTSSPTAKLDVNGTIRAFGAGNAGRITSVDTQVGGATIAFNPQFSVGVPGIETIGAFPIAFYTNSSEKVRITSSGDVGIGTTTPGVKFVNSGGPFSSGPTLGSGVVGSQALLSNNGLYGMYSGVSSNGDVWHQVQRNDANATVYNLVLQPSGGNIYIGTNAPIFATSSKVQILFDGLSEYGLNFKTGAAAAIPISFIDSTGFQIGRIYYDITGTYYQTFSDYRLKEDLKSINGLELISKIKVYDYKLKSCEKRSYGVMAHELQEVVPQVVSGEKDGKEMQYVDYSKLVPILIQAIKELKGEIELLKQKYDKF
jgi:hypothetical protein